MIYYLIGIKGAAMSSLAKILIAEGHIVKGVDVFEDFYTNKGIYDIDNFEDIKLKNYYYIIGNAYINHKITNMIKSSGYYYKYYPEFLIVHFNEKKWICISGSHGKTTTTKLVSYIIEDCVSLIGDGDYICKDGESFILEACEYKNTFLNYRPNIGLVLNVDYDHPDFFKSEKEYVESFNKFIDNCGICIINGDEISKRNDDIISFGMNKDNDVVFDYEVKDDVGIVKILNKPFYLPILGLHFAYDFVGAYLVCKLLNYKDIDIQNKLFDYKLPKRRMETYNVNNQIIISDYAHHPTEIKAVYESLRLKYKNKRIVAIFEPHTISRLEAYLEDFKTALDLFDECYLYPIFNSVRETKEAEREKELFFYLNHSIYDENVVNYLKMMNDIVLCFLGAGVIDKACESYKLQRL